MAELTFKSPGVSTREIDLSGPSRVGPIGVPAGVIGTANKGRAFYPLVFATLSGFVAEFGAVGPDKFGPMALREWFSNARAGLYLKVLGIGDGKARLTAKIDADARGESAPAGAVRNAGFVVGSALVDADTGRVGNNPKAGLNQGPLKATATLTITAAADKTKLNAETLILTDISGTPVTFTLDDDAAINAAVDGVLLGLGGAANIDAISAAIVSGLNAHAIKITASDASGAAAADAAHAILLTQDVGGVAGNTDIIKNTPDADITLTDSHSETTGMFTGGQEEHGPEGRTHFLSVLMKEAAPGAATATVTKTAAALPAFGDSIKITTTDGVGVRYVIVDTTGNAHNAGDVLIVGDKVEQSEDALVAGDVNVGGIVVILGNADTTFLNLRVQVNAKQAAKLTVSDVDGDGDSFTLTQLAPGKAGNTAVLQRVQATGLDSITGYTTPRFAGGKGERIFSEAGTGLADSKGIKHAPVLRGVMMFPSGVVPGLVASRSTVGNNAPIGLPGLVPAAKATITFLNAVTAGQTITLIDAAAVTRVYTAAADDGEDHSANPPTFERGSGGGTAAAGALIAATDFAAAVNAAASGDGGGHGGSIHATAIGAVVTLVQATAGTAGNKVIATNVTTTLVDIPAAFQGGATSAPLVAASVTAFVNAGTIRGVENGGSPLGKVDTTSGKQEFIMVLNGHKSTITYPSAVTASFDPQSTNYFPNIFNTDPTAIQDAGHYLYTHHDVFNTYAVPVATGNPYLSDPVGKAGSDMAMLLPVAGERNATKTADIDVDRPNAENFCDRFRTAISPWFISQRFGGENQDLFRVHALDDGAGGNSVFKLTITNLKRSQSDRNRFGTFDLQVRSFSDNDREPIVLERFSSVNLNPMSDRYIARVVGDRRLFYDFDKRSGSQKLAQSGVFENNSNHIRVEVSAAVENETMDDTALPFGFRGPAKLNIDNALTFSDPDPAIITNNAHHAIKAPPMPLRRTIGIGQVPKKRVNGSLHWGIQFEADDLYSEPNKNNRIVDMSSTWSSYFPDFDQDKLTMTSLTGSAESDSYNSNKFTLENIQVLTASSTNPDSKEWSVAEYRRDGVLSATIVDNDGNDATGRTRFLNTQGDMDLGSVRKYLRFNTIVAGGFDGAEIFDKEKASFSDSAIMREVSDSLKQGGKEGPTAATYMKAVDVLAERADVDIQLLAIPGVRQTLVTDKAIEAVEDRFDAMYIMDTIVYDTEDTVVTGSTQQVSVTNTVNNFNNRVLDTSFAAAYFPDVILSDPSTGQNVQAPASVPVLGAFALNDQLAHPWFAPAGFTRGAMSNVIETQVKLNRDNLDSLYEVDINPITSFPHTDGVIVFGQKTLLRTQSSLDRVNVRRLLIELRRRVRRVANTFIFEPNRETTLARFSAQVNPILRQIQQQQGVDRFLVKIDTTTTTQNDVENNTLRGKIFLQPTRSVEFISLDFVISNAGAEI